MYKTDMAKILTTRYDNGADFWAIPDGRIGIDNTELWQKPGWKSSILGSV